MTFPESSKKIPLSRFAAVWLAESVGLLEQESGLTSPRPADLPPLSAQADEAHKQIWLLRRAYGLGLHNGLLGALEIWYSRARVAFLLLAVLAILSGVTATLSVFAGPERQLNVFWALIGLIGVHFVSLLAWCVAALLGSNANAGFFGRVWYLLAQYLSRFHDGLDKTNHTILQRGLTQALGDSQFAKWRIRVTSHSLWLIVLSSSVIALLLVLSLQSYGFVLETTILPPQAFVSAVHFLGAVPSLLGFIVPDETMIAAAINSEGISQDSASRRAWASLLCGMLMVYAVLPRLGFYVYARLRLVQESAKLQLDLTKQYYGELLCAELAQRTGIVKDPAPVLRAPPQVQKQFKVKGAGIRLIAFELAAPVQWPGQQWSQLLAATDIVDTGQQRQQVLDSLSTQAVAKLLIACDVSLSPDRGSLRWIADVSHHAEQLRIVLLSAASSESRNRSDIWKESLLSIGLEQTQVMTDELIALQWVSAND
ncbi:MAG: DUF2868 domain-containing protein [Pseudohongiellaceae bacterium]|nr:DUF2868 domain-containing protein [Pseudohongiellaceae bacterium]